MAERAVTEATLRALLAKLAETADLVAPVRKGRVVEYAKTTAEAALISDEIPYKSPKEFYFPQAERLMSFEGGGAEENTKARPAVIFGAKPCDLEALRVMSAVFLEGRYADPFYARHMRGNLVIGLACEQKKPGCFCGELGIDMAFSDFCDIFLTPRGGGEYAAECLTDKGKAALAALPETAQLAREGGRGPKERGEAALSIPPETDEAALFGAVDWAKLTETCQGCGLCTYVCPTCHCFEFRDIEQDGRVDRYRCWDSCMFPKFTLHASGHNPRATKAERYRQRVLHKYLYVKKNTGLAACTGCGRCVRGCPVGISIRDVAAAVMEVSR